MENTTENAFDFYKNYLKANKPKLFITDLATEYAKEVEKHQFDTITQWQQETFPDSSALSKVYHLIEEVEELKEAIKNKDENVRLEIADCFILLFGIANLLDYSFDDVKKFIDEKMEINKARKWGKAKDNGVINHITNAD
jgi:NTP pyrophosphatase (non-canonical NTP hydrolase)